MAETKDKPGKPTNTADAQLAKNNAQHAAILAEHKARSKWTPTPTQEENDQVALGVQDVEKKPDGSPVEADAGTAANKAARG